MASVAGTKRKAENKSCKIKYTALKELEKGSAPKNVAARFGVPSSTLSTWKKTRRKYSSNITAGTYQSESSPKNTSKLIKLLINGSWCLEVRIFLLVGRCWKKKPLNSLTSWLLNHLMLQRGGLQDGKRGQLTYFYLEDYKIFYKSFASFSCKISTNFFSARKNSLHGTFIPRPSPALIGFKQEGKL